MRPSHLPGTAQAATAVSEAAGHLCCRSRAACEPCRSRAAASRSWSTRHLVCTRRVCTLARPPCFEASLPRHRWRRQHRELLQARSATRIPGCSRLQRSPRPRAWHRSFASWLPVKASPSPACAHQLRLELSRRGDSNSPDERRAYARRRALKRRTASSAAAPRTPWAVAPLGIVCATPGRASAAGPCIARSAARRAP